MDGGRLRRLDGPTYVGVFENWDHGWRTGGRAAYLWIRVDVGQEDKRMPLWTKGAAPMQKTGGADPRDGRTRPPNVERLIRVGDATMGGRREEARTLFLRADWLSRMRDVGDVRGEDSRTGRRGFTFFS